MESLDTGITMEEVCIDGQDVRPARRGTHYDYDNQAWVVDGRYVTCGHPQRPSKVYTFDCECYGKAHAGELHECSPTSCPA